MKTVGREGELGAINTNTEVTVDYDRATPGTATPLGPVIAEILFAAGVVADTDGDNGVVGFEMGGDALGQSPISSRVPIAGAAMEGTAVSSILGQIGRWPTNWPCLGEGGLRFGLLVAGDDVLVGTEHVVAVFP